jgi:hypothetical protein
MSWIVLPCGKRVSTHTHAFAWVEWPIWFLYDQEKLCVLIDISTSFYISVYFWDALWLCYQLIMHAYSDTDLRKFDLCKFFSAFLVFQCGASGRSTLTSGQTGGPDDYPLESGRRWSPHVRTEMEPTCPDACYHHRPNGLFVSSGRARPFYSFPRQWASGRHQSTVRTGTPQRL